MLEKWRSQAQHCVKSSLALAATSLSEFVMSKACKSVIVYSLNVNRPRTIKQGCQGENMYRIRTDLLKKPKAVKRTEHLHSLSSCIGANRVRSSGTIRLEGWH
jgi:hypothetical protein